MLLLDDEAVDEDESPLEALLEEEDSAEPLVLLDASDDAAGWAGSASVLVELVLFL